MLRLVRRTVSVDGRTDGTDVGSKFGVLSAQARFHGAKLSAHITPERHVKTG